MIASFLLNDPDRLWGAKGAANSKVQNTAIIHRHNYFLLFTQTAHTMGIDNLINLPSHAIRFICVHAHSAPPSLSPNIVSFPLLVTFASQHTLHFTSPHSFTLDESLLSHSLCHLQSLPSCSSIRLARTRAAPHQARTGKLFARGRRSAIGCLIYVLVVLITVGVKSLSMFDSSLCSHSFLSR